jgi:hypothetical protein
MLNIWRCCQQLQTTLLLSHTRAVKHFHSEPVVGSDECRFSV